MVRQLKEQLQQRAQDLAEENATIRSEVSSLRAQVSQWSAQLVAGERGARALRDQLRRARDLCRDVDRSYQAKAQCAEELQCQLEHARARGAALCEDARLVLDSVRRWASSTRNIRREQEQKIKDQEETIASLRQRLNNKPIDRTVSACCSNHIPRPRPSQTSLGLPAIRLASCSRLCEGARRESATETASGSSAPAPPLRMGRRKSAHDGVRNDNVYHDSGDIWAIPSIHQTLSNIITIS
nr:unnamed protein product [Amyelois transitella]